MLTRRVLTVGAAAGAGSWHHGSMASWCAAVRSRGGPSSDFAAEGRGPTTVDFKCKSVTKPYRIIVHFPFLIAGKLMGLWNSSMFILWWEESTTIHTRTNTIPPSSQ